jgi:hypothetical protein
MYDLFFTLLKFHFLISLILILQTYTILINDNYQPEEFLSFRTKNLVNACISLAKEEQFEKINLLIDLHPGLTLVFIF